MTQAFCAALRRLWPRASKKLLGAIIETADDIFARYQINTPLRLAHFMAQVSHESSGGTITAENMNYTTPARIAAVWPSRFTEASARAYVRNPRKLASKVYNGRMGNRAGTDDGYNYRGRGLLQITGREAYADMAKRTGLDLIENPDLAFDPAHALEIAAAEFKKLNCLAACDSDDVRLVTRRVNGGYIGLAERKAWLVKWKAALRDDRPVGLLATADGLIEPLETPPSIAGWVEPVRLPDGDVIKGDPVLWSVQYHLKAMNYNPGTLDGKWGGMVAEAIAGFINDRELTITAPTSPTMFADVVGELQVEIGKAEAESFKRPVCVERAVADAKTVAAVAPEIKPVNRGFLATAWASVLAFFSAVGNAVSDQVKVAWDFFTDHKDDLPSTDSGIVSTAWSYVAAVPTTVWILLAAAGLALIAWQVHQARKQITAQVQTGERK